MNHLLCPPTRSLDIGTNQIQHVVLGFISPEFESRIPSLRGMRDENEGEIKPQYRAVFSLLYVFTNC